MDADRMGAYPKPDHVNWEDEYRLAYSKDEVYTKLLQVMKNWVSEADEIIKEEQAEERGETKDPIYE